MKPRFKDSIQQKMYEHMLTLPPVLFYGSCSSGLEMASTGGALQSAFWKGYAGDVKPGYLDKQSPAYACYVAGKKVARCHRLDNALANSKLTLGQRLAKRVGSLV